MALQNSFFAVLCIYSHCISAMTSVHSGSAKIGGFVVISNNFNNLYIISFFSSFGMSDAKEEGQMETETGKE